MAAIARELGCSRARLYQAFGSREALEIYVATAEWRALGHLLRVVALSAQPEASSITACWTAVLRWERQAPGRMRLCALDVQAPKKENIPEDLLERFLGSRNVAFEYLTAAIGPDVSPDEVWALFVGWVLLGGAAGKNPTGGPETLLRALSPGRR